MSNDFGEILSKMDYYSPLRYPGGKGKVAKYFKQIFTENLLCDGVYVEPYAGGASVALSLLINEYASKVIINDIDRSIYAFWYSVINRTADLCQMIKDTPVTPHEWEVQKRIQKEKTRCSLLKLGFSTFFLNRTNRSGIINAGIIGGKAQSGKWKMDARYNKIELIRRIERISQYRNKIELYNLDAVALVKKLRRVLPSNTLFYFDPPYYVKGQDLYLNYYNYQDHQQIADEIINVSRQKWIVTYDNVRQIKKLYSEFRQVKYTLNYSAAKANKGEEIMIFSDNLFVDKRPTLGS